MKKGLVANSSNRIANSDRGQAVAFLKGRMADGGNFITDYHFLDGG